MKRTIKDEKRQGIALIIVLGMLSVMMVLGVAFVIAMRTERVAAGNYMEVMKARHLVYTALARAMDDIDEDLKEYGTETYPAWPTNYPYVQQHKSVDLYSGDAPNVIPEPIFLLSRKLASPGRVSGANGSRIYDDNATWPPNGISTPDPDDYWIERIVSGTPSNNVVGTIGSISPGGALNTTISGWTNGAAYRTSIPQWQEVQGGGKVAYLVVNLSGLLDGYVVGHLPEPPVRTSGAGPSDIILDSLSDVGGANTFGFINSRDGESQRYDTTARMIANNPVLDSDTLANLWAYSHYLLPVDGDPNDLPVDLSFNNVVEDLVPKKAAIIAALSDSVTAGSARSADWIYKNLIDYVDEDLVPGNEGGAVAADLGSGAVESVPMINEVVVANKIVVDGDDTINLRRSSFQVKIEAFYPFVNDQPVRDNNFYVEAVYEYTLRGGTPGGFLPVGEQKESAQLNRADLTGSGYAVVELPRRSNITETNKPPVISYDLEIKSIKVWQGSVGGPLVDQVPAGRYAGSPLRFRNVSITPGAAGTTVESFVGRECIDPRYNYFDFSHGNVWSAEDTVNESLRSQNAATTDFLAANPDEHDDTTDMHVANAPLGSIGELGYLADPGERDPVMWRTIRLYDHDDNGEWGRVLDRFSLTNAPVVYGRVNPNSEHLDVLTAAFNRMPMDTYPGQPGASGLTEARAAAAAQALLTATDGRSLTVPSDIGRHDLADSLFTALGIAAGNELQKEALIRDMAGIFHTRQNLFAILLAGKSKIAVEQRALVIVWRDPVADSNGQHPSFIRWFTWLEK